MRIVGLDIHRAFAEAVAWDDGKLKRLGRIDMRRHLLEAFAKRLTKGGYGRRRSDRQRGVVGVGDRAVCQKVVIANPKQVRVIAHAKIKTDTIDASVLAQLYVSGFLPEVWVPDEPTQALRRQVTRRNQIVRQRSRLKNIIQSILHSHLILRAFFLRVRARRGQDVAAVATARKLAVIIWHLLRKGESYAWARPARKCSCPLGLWFSVYRGRVSGH